MSLCSRIIAKTSRPMGSGQIGLKRDIKPRSLADLSRELSDLTRYAPSSWLAHVFWTSRQRCRAALDQMKAAGAAPAVSPIMQSHLRSAVLRMRPGLA